MRHAEIPTIIPFAESSAELTFEAIEILSNLARDVRLTGGKGDIICLEVEPEPVTGLRLAQIRDFLIDLGVPSGQVVSVAAPSCTRPFIAIRAISPYPPAPTEGKTSSTHRPVK